MSNLIEVTARVEQVKLPITTRPEPRNMGKRRPEHASDSDPAMCCSRRANEKSHHRVQKLQEDENTTSPLVTTTRHTRCCCTSWPMLLTRESTTHRHRHCHQQQQAPTQRARRALASAVLSYVIVIITLMLASSTPVSSQLPQPQYQSRQRSPIYTPPLHQQQQHQYQPANQLVNNLQMAYQNDQPAQQQQQPTRQQQRQQFQADLDNVIESTTTTSTNSNLHQHQAFPLVSSLASASSARPLYQQQQQTCQLPVRWAGRWFQLNKDTIRVTNSEISDKGLCRDRKGDKFLFEQAPKQTNGVAAEPCLVCLVINERHLNVLQYKESTCQPIPAQYLNRTGASQLLLDNDHSLLDTICSDITGDAQLESMFRLDTPATECPISGKYQFTYDNCREPLSSLDSCLDKKQLNFKFSACQDVGESKTEVLKCYADWSEGNNYYMIGRLEHASNQLDRGKFRCFLYEKSLDGQYIQMAQSLEESCYGLINANEGPKTLRLTARQPTNSNKCRFPDYIQSQSDNWLSVDNSLIYMFNANSSKYQVKETREGNVIEEAACLEQVRHPHAQAQAFAQQHQAARSIQTSAAGQQQPSSRIYPPSSRVYPPSSNHFNNQIDQVQHQGAAPASRQATTINDVVYLVQITKNCYSTDYCVRFYRRTSGIVQIDHFMALPGEDGQQRCRNAFIGAQPQTRIITTNLEPQQCPFEGAYTIEAPRESDFSYNPSNIFICPRQSWLTAQCDDPTRLRIHYKCSPAKYMIKNLYCLGSWTTNGLVRLLLADDERQRYSAWYRDYSPVGPSDASQNAAGLSRSQQLLGLAAGTGSQQQPQATPNPLASIVDLQIALILAQPAVTKPMQVRLTRHSHCSELRGYSSQGSLGGSLSGSSSLPSYAPPASSATATNQLTTSSLSALLASITLAVMLSTAQWQTRSLLVLSH